MTKAQIILKKWIKTQFTDEVEIEFPTDATATITDKNGESMTISLNLYCDILEVPSKKILATSDLPHDMELVEDKIPQSWTLIPYYSANP